MGMKCGKVRISWDNDKTSHFTLGFPRLYPLLALNLTKHRTRDLLPVIPTLNNNNNLSYVKGFFKKGSGD